MAIWWFLHIVDLKNHFSHELYVARIEKRVVGWGGIFPIHPHFVSLITLHEIETWRHTHASPLLRQTPDRISLGLQDITYLSVTYLSIHPSSIIIHYSFSSFSILHMCHVFCHVNVIWALLYSLWILLPFTCNTKSHEQTGWDLCLFAFHFLLIPPIKSILIPILNALLVFHH